MKRNVVGIYICVMLIIPLLQITAIAGDPENPEVQDKIRDVKLFDVFGFPLQAYFKYVDVVSVWFYEDGNNSNYLHVSLQIRDLEDKTDGLDAIYVVSWTYNNNGYSASVHANPNGITPLLAGKTDKEGNDYVEWVICDGSFDHDNDIINWVIPKDSIGNPPMGNKLTNIHPHTHLRFTYDSGLPMMDLFKDLAWNAKIKKDYTLKY